VKGTFVCSFVGFTSSAASTALVMRMGVAGSCSSTVSVTVISIGSADKEGSGSLSSATVACSIIDCKFCSFFVFFSISIGSSKISLGSDFSAESDHVISSFDAI
jgi:hypothetical protein